jgi:membrane-bound serine protease (ClpP class)
MKRVAPTGSRPARQRAVILLASLVAICLAALSALGQDPTDPPRPTAAVVTVDGPIGPATAGYITDEITRASERDRDVIVLKMDTPGGLSASMREIIAAILASDVPVATYVAPRGARAASAGTYILYASHVAAMAPGTTLGAATPVQMGGDGGSPLPGGGDPQESPPESPTEDGGEAGEAGADDAPAEPMDAKKAKVLNDAIAYIRALAELRGRNVDWAEKAVREAATLTVDEAVAQDVADLKAANVAELLDAADGRTVKIGEREVTLTTANADLEDRAPDWRDRLLATITHPNIAFILMTIGIYGLIFELSNPGAIVPGVLGAICLMVGLYALNVLPVNYAGLALVGLGIALMTAEAFAPSFGVLGLGGLAAFGLGATILFDTGSAAFALSYWVIAGVTAATGAVLILLIGYLIRAQRGRVVTGAPELIGAEARVESWAGATGRVWLHGERWNARGPDDLKPGQTVVVTALDGLTVTVARTREAPAPPSTAGGPA